MPFLPYTLLFVGPERVIAISGSHIQVISSITGKLLASATSSSIIRAGAVTGNFTHLATAEDNKQLKVWRIADDGETTQITEESSRELAKKSLEVHVTSDGQTILASDKFGDIYSYPMVPNTLPLETGSISDEKAKKESDEKSTPGYLLLGHASTVTSFLLTTNEDFLISGDRDEHIRVSWYPQGYNIERFCLGHRKYLSALHIPAFFPSILVSGGGDHELYIWDWKTGLLLNKIPIYEMAEPFIKVRGGRRGFRRIPRRPDGQGLSRKSKKGKAKRKAAKAASQTPDDEDVEMAEVAAETAELGDPSDSTPVNQSEQELNEISFAVSKIGSLSVGGVNFVVFTAVGISAFFYFQMLSDGSWSALQLVDLSYPIVNFVPCETSTLSPKILISLDNNVKPDSASKLTEVEQGVYLLEWNGTEFVMQSDSPLLNSMNKTARIEVSEEALAALDLYSALSNLPKSREELAEDGGGTINNDSSSTPVSGQTTPIVDPFAAQKEHTIKAKGRNRVRDKLLINQQRGFGLNLPPSQRSVENPPSRESSEPEQKRVRVGDELAVNP